MTVTRSAGLVAVAGPRVLGRAAMPERSGVHWEPGGAISSERLWWFRASWWIGCTIGPQINH